MLSKAPLKVRAVLVVSMLFVFLLGGGCTPGQGLDSHLRLITRPYSFNIVKWEFHAIEELFYRDGKSDVKASKVTEYFSNYERITKLKSEIEAINAGNRQGDLTSLEAELNKLQQQNTTLADTVARIIEGQIREALSEQGIFNPIDRYIKLKVGFPPVSFKLEPPPHLLVVSPRDRIESMREVLLRQNLSPEEMESIEAGVDKLDVSSLVVELGGFASYPSIVTSNANLRFILDTATEEWLHQYLAFKPLGFRYLLDLTGISRNYEIATMNETVASMVSKEIGSIVYAKYYPPNEKSDAKTEAGKSEFDFNQEMREIRRTVDKYLAQGEIEPAEEFMEQKRQYLASRGHHLRKLNQAYFAFHGAYADSPASISPIGLELKELRNRSSTLKDFLETVAAMTSRQALKESIKSN